MFKFFECFAKYDAFCSHIFDYACLRLIAIAIKEVRKYASKTFLKMAGGRMHVPHSTPLDSPVAISFSNHQENLAYFSHLLAPLVLFFFTKRQSQKGGPWHNGPPLNTLLRAGFRQ